MNMENTLKSLKIKADVQKVDSNCAMTKYYLKLHPGEKVAKIERCATEIALGVQSYSKPIIRVVPEKGLVILEMLTDPVRLVRFEEMIEDLHSSELSLPMAIGKSHDGNNLIADLSIMPHLLIAGTTGSGKSVLLHSIINSLMEGRDIKFAMIDPKKVELSNYENIRQLMYPIITETESALDVLSDLINEMERRFKIMARKSVNTIDQYNRKFSKKNMPYIVLVIDEFSDLMYTAKIAFQRALCKIVQKSRACGIHVIMATQRPSADVVTGIVKANFPARISCMVSSHTDSRVILNSCGAEKLLGKGDSIIKSVGFDMVRFQGAYLSPEKIIERCKLYERSLPSKILNYLRGV